MFTPPPSRILADFSGIKNPAELLATVARARGCASEDEVADFLDPLPVWTNPLQALELCDRLVGFIDSLLRE